MRTRGPAAGQPPGQPPEPWRGEPWRGEPWRGEPGGRWPPGCGGAMERLRRERLGRTPRGWLRRVPRGRPDSLARARASRRRLRATNRPDPPASGPTRRSGPGAGSPGAHRRRHPPAGVLRSPSGRDAAQANRCRARRADPGTRGRRHSAPFRQRSGRTHRSAAWAEVASRQPALAAQAQQGDGEAAPLQAPEEGEQQGRRNGGPELRPRWARTPAGNWRAIARRGGARSRSGRPGCCAAAGRGR